MPYTRYRRRAPYGRKRRARRMYPKKHMTVSKVKRIVDAELKTLVIGNDFAPVAAGTPANLDISSVINQGDTSTTRTGDWIRPVVMHGFITVKGFDGAIAPTNGIRIVLLRWNNDATNDTMFANKVVFDIAAPGGPFSFANKGAFKVLWTRYNQVVNDKQNDNFRMVLPFHIRLSSAPKALFTGVNAKKYQYFLVATSDSITGGEEPSYEIDLTFRYTDS